MDFQTILPLITAVGVIVAIVYSVRGGKRADKQDNEQGARQLSRIEAARDYVKQGVDDIRIDTRALQKETSDLRGCYIRLEESTKSAHKRIDNLEKEIQK